MSEEKKAVVAAIDMAYWNDNRAKILDAIEKAGYRLASNRNGFWLHPVAQPVEQTLALTDFPEAMLSAVDERAAANIDDWAERQPVEPTKETCNAMYVRELLRLLSEQVR